MAESPWLPKEYGTISADFRYRYEWVDQDGKPEDARASTGRLRLGYLTPTWEGLSGYIEGETIQHIGDTHFNDGINNLSRYPTVGDPKDTALNQLYATFAPNSFLTLQFGRQSIAYDSERFIGRSRFRQNDNTHDAALVRVTPMKDLEFAYSYTWNVNRTLGDRSPLGEYEGDTHLFHASYNGLPEFKFSAYGYLLGFDEFQDRTLASQTYGARMEWQRKGEGFQPLAVVDLAMQQDYRINPLNYSEEYVWLEGGISRKDGWRISGVYERLGGDGTAAMQTPIATLHGVNGWSDVITTIPANGLQDFYIDAKVPLPAPEGQKIDLIGQVHYFLSTHDSMHYGQEYGIGVVYSPWKDQSFMLKLAQYDAEDLFTDTTKVWLSYEIKL